MLDAALVFVPQWSPFQPALALPSLSAWLKRAGFSVRSLDLNLELYHWLLSDECGELLKAEVAASGWSPEIKEAYATTFSNAGAFRSDVERVRSGESSPEEYLRRNYLALKSLETYLLAVSHIARRFTISPYGFQLTEGGLSADDLESQVQAPPELLERFFRKAIAESIGPLRPRVVGLSCIGQEQLYPTLLLGRLIKESLDATVVVGGTIFSRIFERGSLRNEWFDRYFDVVVRNEGERSLEAILRCTKAGRALTRDVPGAVFRSEGRQIATPPSPPLSPAELPIPDFDDLPLHAYLSPEVTLPLLSSRGCYWGKCEFCHHGMVYGEKYAAYGVTRVLETVRALSSRHGVRHFAFNDEALPPKIARAMGESFPEHSESRWTFTGLIKFEPFFKAEDFARLHAIGFRSLYVGLESASERVLSLMRKNCKRETIVRNLADGTAAGIWMHCFLFFGFPGEREEEAKETYDFVVGHSEIIGSFGAGTFSLEHNAPIFHHYADFGVLLKPAKESDVDVYYDYRVSEGVSAGRALHWQQRLTEATSDLPSYAAAKWVPRELLLCLLSAVRPDALRKMGAAMLECGGLQPAMSLPEIATRTSFEGARLVVNRLNGRTLILRRSAAALFDLYYERGASVGEIRDEAPLLFDKLAFSEEHRAGAA